MRRWICLFLCLVWAVSVLTLSGCLMNVFQTARTIGRDNALLTIGVGRVEEQWTPQARVVAGVTDRLDLGLQAGIILPDPEFLGATADLKLCVAESETSALAVGAGVGHMKEADGWAGFGAVYVEVSPFQPIMYVSPADNILEPSYILWRPLPTMFASYQAILALASTNLEELMNHITAGIAIPVGMNGRLLLQVDYNSEHDLLSYGIALEMSF